jgi:hypothetical protein
VVFASGARVSTEESAPPKYNSQNYEDARAKAREACTTLWSSPFTCALKKRPMESALSKIPPTPSPTPTLPAPNRALDVLVDSLDHPRISSRRVPTSPRARSPQSRVEMLAEAHTQSEGGAPCWR